LYDTILSRLKETDISRNVDVSNIRIVEKAVLPEYPVGPNKKRNLLIAVVAGLMAGIGFAFFREYVDRTLHSEEDVQKHLGLPVLAVIPMAKKSKGTPYAAHTTASHAKASNPKG
jgi:capsular polysaccharide biosynthesis protein